MLAGHLQNILHELDTNGWIGCRSTYCFISFATDTENDQEKTGRRCFYSNAGGINAGRVYMDRLWVSQE